MRDVTDNVTGELDVDVKRGRGRPRKADALSNAERQAAFRARRRAERVSPMHRPVVDPDALQDVAELEDEMAEIKAELAEARKAAETWQSIASDLRKQLCQAEMERDAVIGWGVSRDEGKLQAALKARRAPIKKSALAEFAPAKSVTSTRVTGKALADEFADSDWPFPSGN